MKKNIVVTVLTILVLGLGGYLVYDKVLSNDNNEIKNNGVNENSIENKDNKDIFSLTQIAFDGIAITYNGEVYVNVGYWSGSENISSFFGQEIHQKWNEVRTNQYKEYTFGDFKYLDSNNYSFKGLKLNTNNVKNVYSLNNGQALTQDLTLVLLHNDNTVSIISIYSIVNGKTEVTKINELNNIVDIVSENVPMGGFKTYAVTSSGEKINIATYIPDDYLTF